MVEPPEANLVAGMKYCDVDGIGGVRVSQRVGRSGSALESRCSYHQERLMSASCVIESICAALDVPAKLEQGNASNKIEMRSARIRPNENKMSRCERGRAWLRIGGLNSYEA